MAYEVMHMKKIKSKAGLVGLLKHNFRERVPSNADPERLKTNNYIGSTSGALERYSELLPEKVRKNAVHAVAIVMSGGPEWFEKATKKDIEKWKKLSLEWVTEKFGGRENLLCAAAHFDEKTPHMHVIMMPVVDGKLNARAVMGGSKYRMRELQDDFHEKVGKPLGMERGIPNPRIKHTEPKEYAREMRKLKAELHAQKKALDAREGVLDAREAELKEWSNTLDELADATNKARSIIAQKGDHKVVLSVQTHLRGLNDDEIKQAWDAMDSKVKELKEARYSKLAPAQNLEQSKTKGRK